MSKNAVVHARIESDVKTSAERVLHQLGLSPTEAIRIFYRQISLRKGLPFQVHVPNALTAKTLTESREGKNIKHFKSVKRMFESWGP